MVVVLARASMDALVDVLDRFESDSLTLESLKRAQSVLCDARSSRFSRGSRIPACARLRQCWSVDELVRFFGLVSSESDRDAFLFMFAFGLRASEVSSCVFHEPSLQLRVFARKTGRFDVLPVYPSALRLARRSREFSVSCDGLRNRFRSYRDRDPLFRFSYARSADGRSLSQFSSKSLRKSAVQLVYESSRDPILTSMFSRHSLPSRYGQLASYLYFDEVALRGLLEESLGSVLRRLG